VLAVDAPERLSRLRSREQRVVAAREVLALPRERRGAGEPFRAVLRARVGPRRGEPHVVDLERQDRQPVDHRTGGLGVMPRICPRRDVGDPCEQRLVDRLDGVVAALVVAVDRALHGGNR